MRLPEEIAHWAKSAAPPECSKQEKQYVLEAATAVGRGSTVEQLTRLMVWLGGKLTSRNPHSQLHNPIEILADGNAWCDQQCRVFRYFAWNLLGITAKDIALHHTDGKSGHTVIEARYDHSWHLFDVHSIHMSLYRSEYDHHVLSYDEIVADPSIVRKAAHWWRGQNGQGKEGFYDIAGGARAERGPEEGGAETHCSVDMRAPWAAFIQGKE